MNAEKQVKCFNNNYLCENFWLLRYNENMGARSGVLDCRAMASKNCYKMHQKTITYFRV